MTAREALEQMREEARKLGTPNYVSKWADAIEAELNAKDAMIRTKTERLVELHDELAREREAVLKVAEDVLAHGSHWRQPYKAFCEDMAAALRRAVGRE